MLQRLLWLLALFGAIWAMRRLFSSAGRPQRPQQSAGQAGTVPPRGEGEMVRDRVCNTFLPRARALTVSAEDGEHFFCSERCREIHLERKAG